MSSTTVLEPPSKTQTHKPQTKNTNNNTSKRKNKYDRSGRKRSKSFSGCGIMNQKPVLPTKFLLGGNINDPLNLNSLQDEEINRAMNAVTPKSSPIPTPPRRKGQIEVIIPPNIHDPLNLIDCADNAEYEQQLCSPLKKGRKKRIKKRRTISSSMDVEEQLKPEARTPEASSDSAKIPEVPENVNVKSKGCRDLSIELSPKKDKGKRKSEEHGHGLKKFKNSMDKIVSPVVPQPGAWLKRNNMNNKWPEPRRQNKVENEVLPQFKEKNKQFQYGNYNRYYGYRNPTNEFDPRLKLFAHHLYLFEGKDILDIGCNIGHITLSIARDFGSKSITGIDIDQRLIAIARKNVKHYVKSTESPRGDESVANCPKKSSFDDAPKGRGFPNNVSFKQCNYVLDDDNLIALDQPQYDVILCLSVTKWIHLNFGDSGIKQAFRRMYAQLRPGGKLILEPQAWSSYKGKKKLTETIYRTFNSIEFFPDKFTEYLLSPAVGFAKSEVLGAPSHHAKGFRRIIQVFTKSTMFPSERVEATPINITPTDCAYHNTKTEKYESRAQTNDCVEHVYTSILDRYCGCQDDNDEANNSIAESLKVHDDASHCCKDAEVEKSVSCDLTAEAFEDDLKNDSTDNT